MAAKIELANLTPEQFEDIGRVARGEMTIKGKDGYIKVHPQSEDVVRRLVRDWLTSREQSAAAKQPPIYFENDLWEAVKKHGSQVQRLRNTEIEINVHLPDDEPVMVAWMSDLHIGHVNTNHEQIQRDAELVKNTPGLYVILGGDLTDNVNTAVAARGMHHEQLTPVDVQKELIQRLAEFIGPENIIAGILGNHDEWSLKNDGFDPVKWLAKEVGFPYLGAFGYANVHVGNQVYRHLLAHQFRMNSSFNKTHAGKRLMDFVGDAHLVYMGHKHDPASEQVYVRREKRFFAQAGSYLRESVYGNRLGFTESSPEMPGSLLAPDRFSFLGLFDAFGEGPWILNAARERYGARVQQ